MRIEQSEIGDCVPSPWGEGKQDVKTFTRSVGKRERLETLNAACECGWPCANTYGNSNGVVSFQPGVGAKRLRWVARENENNSDGVVSGRWGMQAPAGRHLCS